MQCFTSGHVIRSNSTRGSAAAAKAFGAKAAGAKAKLIAIAAAKDSLRIMISWLNTICNFPGAAIKRVIADDIGVPELMDGSRVLNHLCTEHATGFAPQ